MSDVKKFNVLGQIADIKDVIARENAIKALNKMSNFVNVVTDCGADNTAQTDSTEAIKKAFDIQDAFIYFPKGNYLISSTIKVKSNTYVFGYRALIQSTTSNMVFFINDSNGTLGGYDANNFITFDSLRFRSLRINQTIISICHCSDIRICNCTFESRIANKVKQDWHFLEIISSKKAWISNCVFDAITSFSYEMIQLDAATNYGSYPWFGPYDNSPSTEITIENCNFSHPEKIDYYTLSSEDTAIGNRNSNESAPLYHVIINNCQFNNIKNIFRFINLNYSIISNNVANNCMSGFAFIANQTILSTQIINNSFTGNRNDFVDKIDTAYGRGISIGIKENTPSSNNTITGNIIDNFASYGIFINGKYTNISNNIITSCGYSGLYTDYDCFKCSIHDNTVLNNAIIDQENHDIVVNHGASSKLTEGGANDIYNNKCDSIRGILTNSDNTIKSRVYNNVYSSIEYPTNFEYLNMYGNIKYSGNSGYYYKSEVLDKNNTSNGSWNTISAFTCDHTCFMIITFVATINANFEGAATIRLRSGFNTNLAYQTSESSKPSTTGGPTITIIAKVNANEAIYGELFFVYGGGGSEINGISTLTAVELPIPLENAEASSKSVLHTSSNLKLLKPIENIKVNSESVLPRK